MDSRLITRVSQLDRRWPMAMLALLLVVQMFVPVMSATAMEKSDSGKFVLVCTLQGLQQMLLSDEGSADASGHFSQQGPMDCPLCSLSNIYMSALATLSPDTPKDPSHKGYPLLENEIVFPDKPVYETPARAPPIA